MSEVWEKIQDCPKYSVSTYGRVRNDKSGRILKQFHNGKHCKYLNVNIHRQRYCVHKLVADAFLPHDEWHKVVTHLDGDFTNNRVENLKWKHDRYNDIPHKYHWLLGGEGTYTCPFCGTVTECEEGYIPKFCMECGTDMRGEE